MAAVYLEQVMCVKGMIKVNDFGCLRVKNERLLYMCDAKYATKT